MNVAATGRADRRGFSLVELLIAMAVLAILAGLALPSLQGAVIRAYAVDVVANVNVIRVAAHDVLSDTGTLPAPGGAPGSIPAAMVSSLPEGFDFAQQDITYSWDVWPAGTSPFGVETGVIEVRVETTRFRLAGGSEDLLLKALIDLLPTDVVRLKNASTVQVYVLP